MGVLEDGAVHEGEDETDLPRPHQLDEVFCVLEGWLALEQWKEAKSEVLAVDVAEAQARHELRQTNAGDEESEASLEE